jgi:ribosomal protein S12 methylthiotransferase
VKIGFVSLGCPKNLVDSETMLGIIAETYQMEITSDPAEADADYCQYLRLHRSR